MSEAELQQWIDRVRRETEREGPNPRYQITYQLGEVRVMVGQAQADCSRCRSVRGYYDEQGDVQVEVKYGNDARGI